MVTMHDTQRSVKIMMFGLEDCTCVFLVNLPGSCRQVQGTRLSLVTWVQLNCLLAIVDVNSSLQPSGLLVCTTLTAFAGMTLSSV